MNKLNNERALQIIKDIEHNITTMKTTSLIVTTGLAARPNTTALVITYRELVHMMKDLELNINYLKLCIERNPSFYSFIEVLMDAINSLFDQFPLLTLNGQIEEARAQMTYSNYRTLGEELKGIIANTRGLMDELRASLGMVEPEKQ